MNGPVKSVALGHGLRSDRISSGCRATHYFDKDWRRYEYAHQPEMQIPLHLLLPRSYSRSRDLSFDVTLCESEPLVFQHKCHIPELLQRKHDEND